LGETFVPGPVSGRNYGFRIAGDAPSVDEQRRINAIIRQREAEFAREYESRFGVEAEGAEGSGLLNYLGEIPKGFLRESINTLTGTVPGLVEATPESWLSPESRDWVRDTVARGSDWMTSRLQPDIGFEGNTTAEIIGNLAGGLGSFATLAGVTAANPYAGVGVALGMGANEAAERARAADATPDERRQSAQWGLLPGLTNLMPVERLLRLRLGEDAAVSLLGRLRRIGETAGIESAQEAAEQYAQNLIAQGVYNPEQDLGEGLLESAGYGAGVGGIAQALMDLALPGRRRSAAAVPPEPETTPAGLLALPPPSAFPPPDVINMPPTGPEQVSGQLGANLPAYPRGPSVPPTVAPSAAQPQGELFSGLPTQSAPLLLDPTTQVGYQMPLALPESPIAPLPQLDLSVALPGTQGNLFAPPGTPAPTTLPGGIASLAPRPPVGTQPTPTVPVAPTTTPETATPAAPPAPKQRRVKSPLAPTVAPEAPVAPVPGTTSTAPTEAATPTLPVQDGQRPLTKETMKEVLKSIGVPPRAAVADAVERGDVTNEAEFATRLQRFAANTKNPEAKKRTQEYLRVQEAERNAAPPPTVEEPDVQTPENRGLVALDAAPSGAGPESGIGDGQLPVGADYGGQSAAPGDGGAAPAATSGVVGPDPGRLEQPDSSAVLPADAADAQYPALTPAAAPAAAPAATPPVAPTPQPDRNPMAGGMPGTPTGAAGQAIPRGIPGAPVLDRSRPVTPDTVSGAPQAVAEALAAENDVLRATVGQQIANWFRANAPMRVQEAFDRTPPTDRETSTVRADDMVRVVQLLETGPKREQNKNLSPAGAARRYFSRSPDPGYALHMMAYDAALADLDGQPGFYTARTIRGDAVRPKDGKGALNEMQTAEPLTEALDAEIAMMEGLGPTAARLAEQWVEANLSPDAVAEFRAMRNGRASTDRAAYAARDYETQSKERDRRMLSERAAAAEAAAMTDAGTEGTRRSEGMDPRREQELRSRQARQEAERAERSARIAAIQEAESKFVERQAEPTTRRQPGMPSPPPWSASFSLWEADAHPRVGALLRAGDLSGALQLLAMTAPSGNLRALADKLATRMAGTKVAFVSADEMARIRTVMAPETPSLGVEAPSGVYMHPRSDAQLAAMRREGFNEAADMAERYAGSIIFNEDVPLAPELVLHEAVHAVADATLTKPSHVLTRQLDTMRVNLLKTLPPESYGLTNVRELLAEAMTNPAFRSDLSMINIDGKPYSAWAQFKHTMRNFMRTLMGRPTVKMDSAQATLDRALDRVLSDGPGGVRAGELMGASFAPNPAQRVREWTNRNMTVPSKAEAKSEISRVWNMSWVPQSWKDTWMRATVPLQYVGEYAAQYMPSATEVYNTTRQYKADEERIGSKALATVNRVAAVLNKYDGQQSVIDAWNKTRLFGSLFRVDPRKPEAAYKGYDFSWYDVRPDGSKGKPNVSKRYATEAERDAAMNAKRASLPEGQRRAAKVKRNFDEDAEQLAQHKELRAVYNTLPADMKTELDRAFALPLALNKELVDAVKVRLESLMPQNKAMQDKVFGEIYDKVLAGQLIDPYQALNRSGSHWISYTTYDPVTGGVELFKTSFVSATKQEQALQTLDKMNAAYYAEAQRLMRDPRPAAEFKAAVEAKELEIPLSIATEAGKKHPPIMGIQPYQNIGTANMRPQVPMEFVAQVMKIVDANGELTKIDADNPDKPSVKQQIVEIMFDAVPETSFMHAFRTRADRRGFEGDFTALQDGLSAGDTATNLTETNQRLAQQVVRIKYGAKMAALRNKLEEEANIAKETRDPGSSLEDWSRKSREIASLFTLLTEYTRTPFEARSKIAGSAVGTTYMLTLGFNPSTAILSAMSVPMFFAPYAGGRYGYRNAVAAVGHATRSLGGTGKTRSAEIIGPNGETIETREPVSVFDFSLDNADFTDPKNAYLKPLHTYAKTNGVLYRSQIRDELMGENPTLAQRMAKTASIMQHQVERYARETALRASYDLDLQQQMGDTRSFSAFIADVESGKITPTPEQSQRAAERAVEMAEKTNGTMFAAGGPKWSTSSLGSVVYLFKRHPLSMMNLLWQTTKNSFGEKTPERAIARKQIAGMLGMLGLTSGLLGLPMMQQIGWLYNLMLADDDEPDFESMVQMQFGALGSYGAVDYLTGLRVSERIGLGSAFYRSGFASDQLPPIYQAIEGFGGPVLGMLGKYVNARPFNLLAEGEYGRAAEAVLPSAFANVMRAGRYATEGINTMRHDPMVDDVGPFGIAAQAMGFMPAAYAQQLAKNAMGSRINNAINTRRSRLLQQRYVAIRQGDFESVREIDARIREFNQRHPYFPITREVMERSMRSHEETTSRMHHGVAYTPALDPLIRQMMEDWGPSSVRA
jgi:hypothetical protein